MTDEEIICTFMEPKPPLPLAWHPGGWPSLNGWWWLMATPGGGMEWAPWRRGGPLDLRTLWEVEERLTPELWRLYRDALVPEDAISFWGEDCRLIHLPAAEKIKALAGVLRPIVTSAAENGSRSTEPYADGVFVPNE